MAAMNSNWCHSSSSAFSFCASSTWLVGINIGGGVLNLLATQRAKVCSLFWWAGRVPPSVLCKCPSSSWICLHLPWRFLQHNSRTPHRGISVLFCQPFNCHSISLHWSTCCEHSLCTAASLTAAASFFSLSLSAVFSVSFSYNRIQLNDVMQPFFPFCSQCWSQHQHHWSFLQLWKIGESLQKFESKPRDGMPSLLCQPSTCVVSSQIWAISTTSFSSSLMRLRSDSMSDSDSAFVLASSSLSWLISAISRSIIRSLQKQGREQHQWLHYSSKGHKTMHPLINITGLKVHAKAAYSHCSHWMLTVHLAWVVRAHRCWPRKCQMLMAEVEAPAKRERKKQSEELTTSGAQWELVWSNHL